MTRDELVALLARLVADGKLTEVPSGNALQMLDESLARRAGGVTGIAERLRMMGQANGSPTDRGQW